MLHTDLGSTSNKNIWSTNERHLNCLREADPQRLPLLTDGSRDAEDLIEAGVVSASASQCCGYACASCQRWQS